MKKLKSIVIGPDHHLTPEEVFFVAHNPNVKIRLSSAARKNSRLSRKTVEEMTSKNEVVYGVTTGFGNFKDKSISHEQIEELQTNLIRSHAAGVGELLPPSHVRAALLVRLNSLAQGFSGVRLKLLETIVAFLEHNIVSVVPSQGSVGASGDLAPLSHIGLAFMGEGEVFYQGKRVRAKTALKHAQIEPLTFVAKEGLGFNNGTAVMAGIAALLIYQAQKLVEIGDVAGALTLEVVCGSSGAFDRGIHKLRPHPGQQKSAQNVRFLVEKSQLVDSDPSRVQDSYSLRCLPQVHGAVRDTLAYVHQVIEKEINAVTDNPIIFSKTHRAISGGNFHGEPIAIAMDMFAIALAELANISERRVAKLTDVATSNGLPPFLIASEKGGLHNGLMIAQYTAAALVSENKVFAHPASVDSIPTSANQEDHVSMGSIAVHKAVQIIKNTEHVLAIELLCAAQGVEFRDSKKLGKGTRNVYKTIRGHIRPLTKDRVLALDIVATKDIFADVLTSSGLTHSI